MKIMFQDRTFAFELLRMLSAAINGGSDINECLVTASRITEGDVESWYREWNATAERIHQIADSCLERGHRVSAYDAYLRASNYYRSAEFFMHMEIGQTDPRALPTYQKSVDCFRQAMRLSSLTYEEVAIPYEGTVLPGYFYRVDDSATPRPTLILHGGYDSTGEELYFGTVPAALQRGYNCLTFEGPGQGSVIRLQHLPFRPDWEQVVTPVVSYLLTRPEVDPNRIVLEGRSLGGYLAPRAAAFEHRLAACVAVDGLYAFAASREFMGQDKPVSSDEDWNALLEREMSRNMGMRWAISQGMWTMRATSPLDCMQKMQQYTMEGVVEQVSCPTLVCDAEKDHFFSGQPKKLYDALTCPKTYLLFTAYDAAEEHCHAGAALLLNQRVFDWLDETLA